MPRAAAVEEIVRGAGRLRSNHFICTTGSREVLWMDGPKIVADGTKVQIADLRNIRVDDGDKNGPRSASLADRNPIILLIWVFGGLH
jgi:hypothetical protein